MDQAAGRLPLMAQCNHGSAKGAAELARQNADIGAEVISFALPRQFPLTDDDQFEFARTVCDAVGTPVLIQDWNPSGSSVGAEFCAKLADVCPNFRYIKLEEPRMGPKVRAIIEATGGRVEVFEGWGGLYMLELVPTGIVGIMPGLALTDVLVRAWRLAAAGESAEALAAFEPARAVAGLRPLRHGVLQRPRKAPARRPRPPGAPPPCATPPSPSTKTPWPTRISSSGDFWRAGKTAATTCGRTLTGTDVLRRGMGWGRYAQSRDRARIESKAVITP